MKAVMYTIYFLVYKQIFSFKYKLCNFAVDNTKSWVENCPCTEKKMMFSVCFVLM